MSGKYRLRTLGCKVNQYESQQLRELLEAHGLQPADPHQTPDLAVVNTCAVTASASAKTRQAIRRASAGGTVPVVVVGCGAVAEAHRLRRIPGVVAVWGHDTSAIEQLRDYVVHRLGSDPDRTAGPRRDSVAGAGPRLRAGGDDGWMSPGWPAGDERSPRATDSNSFIHQTSVAPSPGEVNADSGATETIRRFDGHQRAFLKVQDGCDASCTYCIIPRLRSALSYKPIDAAVAEARALVEAGHREIVLTGIYLGAYGRETAVRRRFAKLGRPGLAELVAALARVEGLARLRLSSLEPGDVTDELLDVLAAHDCCVPHLHLPLQSGSPTVLRRMNRQYTADDFREMVANVRAALDRPAISTDVVVGFPGETEADFEQTVEMVLQAGFCKVHAFPFSPRGGTAAARWKESFVAADVLQDRLARLRTLERQVARRFHEQFVGGVERVLVEGSCARSADVGTRNGVRRGLPAEPPSAPGDPQSTELTFHGRSDRYFEVFFEAPVDKGPRPGELVPVRIDRVSPRRIHGSIQPCRGRPR